MVESTNNSLIYKISPRIPWEEAKALGRFTGAPVDLADGYIHFSTAEQAAETLAKWFHGQDDLVVAAIETKHLGDALKWEPSRGGALFPHLYTDLDMAHLRWTKPIPMQQDGSHIMPNLRTDEGAA